MIIVGNKLYERCADCGAIVRLNKPLLGELHLCLTEAEKEDRQKRGINPFEPLIPFRK